MNVTFPDAPAATQVDAPSGGQRWTFLTNHTHVLIALATNPDARVRDVASRVGVTERAAQRLLHDLVAEGYVLRQKHGRRNTYRLLLDRPLRHPMEAQHTVGDLIEALCTSR